jgi:hypothetical protein
MSSIDFFKDFETVWATNGAVVPFDSRDYQEGWAFIGEVPPELEQFNQLQQIVDQRTAWLYKQIKELARAFGYSIDADSIDALTSAFAKIPAQVNADWNATSGAAKILNKPNLAKVATSGNYSDLNGKPNLAAVATSGSYNDLSEKPAIPAPQVNADWNATSGVAAILNKPDLSGAWTSATLNPMALGGLGNFIIVANILAPGAYIANPQVRWNGPVLPGTWMGCGNYSSGGDKLSLVVRVA